METKGKTIRVQEDFPMWTFSPNVEIGIWQPDAWRPLARAGSQRFGAPGAESE